VASKTMSAKSGFSCRLSIPLSKDFDPDSEGLKRARENGVKSFDNGIESLQENPDLADIVFEATSAKAHAHNAPILKEMGKKAIDLTPAAVGPFFVPSVNLQEEEIPYLDNVNMVTCG